MRLGHRSGRGPVRQAEVPQLGTPLRRKEDVGGFEVTVSNSLFLRRGERLKDLQSDPEHILLGKFLLTDDLIMQGTSGHELHFKKRYIGILFQCLHLHHAGMRGKPGQQSFIA